MLGITGGGPCGHCGRTAIIRAGATCQAARPVDSGSRARGRRPDPGWTLCVWIGRYGGHQRRSPEPGVIRRWLEYHSDGRWPGGFRLASVAGADPAIREQLITWYGHP